MQFYDLPNYNFISFYRAFMESPSKIFCHRAFETKIFRPGSVYKKMKTEYFSGKGIRKRTFRRCFNDTAKKLNKQTRLKNIDLSYKVNYCSLMPIAKYIDLKYEFYEVNFDGLGNYLYISHVQQSNHMDCYLNLFDEPDVGVRDLFLMAIICYIHSLIFLHGTTDFITFNDHVKEL